MTGLAIGWLLLAAGNRSSRTGSLLITISGLLQLGVLVFFILLSSRIHRKTFVGKFSIRRRVSVIKKRCAFPNMSFNTFTNFHRQILSFSNFTLTPGYQMLVLKYSTLIVWVLPLTGLMNTTTGILLMVTKVFCEKKSGCLFTPLQVRRGVYILYICISIVYILTDLQQNVFTQKVVLKKYSSKSLQHY